MDKSYHQINSAIDSSDAKDDVSTEVSGTNNGKHEEEVDKASVKPRKQEKNDSVWLEVSENVKINPSMSTCQCRCSETREVSGCINCEWNFKYENKLHIHFNQVHVCKYDLCGVFF